MPRTKSEFLALAIGHADGKTIHDLRVVASSIFAALVLYCEDRSRLLLELTKLSWRAMRLGVSLTVADMLEINLIS